LDQGDHDTFVLDYYTPHYQGLENRFDFSHTPDEIRSVKENLKIQLQLEIEEREVDSQQIKVDCSRYRNSIADGEKHDK